MENIQHTEFSSSGKFFLKSEEGGEAEIDYRKTNKNEIVIDHTFVPASFQGKGVGKSLVMAVVEWARANKVKIVPQCSFAKKIIEGDESLRDVLY